MSGINLVCLPIFVQGDPQTETDEGVDGLPNPMGVYSVSKTGAAIFRFPPDQARLMALALLAGCIRAEGKEAAS